MKHNVLHKAQQFTFTTDDNTTVAFTIKQHAFNIFVNPGENLWTFDLEGRLMGMFVNGKSIRRTLDNTYFLKTRELVGLDVFRGVEKLDAESIKNDYRLGLVYLDQFANELPDNLLPLVEKIKQWNSQSLDRQSNLFNDVYKPISILPPDQYLALVIQITEGCSYNKCTFCNFYRDRRFKIKSLPAIDEHLLAVKQFIGEGIYVRRSIFLGDANALVIPQPLLLKTFHRIKNVFPQIENFYSFIDVYTGIIKSSTDYAQLADLGLKRVYLGIESGSGELLQLLNKPRIDSNLHKLICDLKKGRVNVGLIFLAGIGGEKFADKHVEESLKLISQLPLNSGDIIYISEYLDTNTEYGKVMDSLGIKPLDRIEIRKQANAFRKRLKKQLPQSVKISVYDIQQFFY